MKRGKYQKSKPHSLRRKPLLVLVCLVLVVGLSIGGTFAYFSQNSGGVTNTFSAGTVGAQVTEAMSGNAKTSIQVYNPGTSPVYVRVRLESYWEDSNGNVAPKASPTVSPTLGSGWTYSNGYYYYTSPLAGGNTTSNMLSSNLTMAVDEDGNKQVIVVLAETVQATPAAAVAAVWGVTADSITG